MKNHQHGFGIVEVIILLVILGLVGLSGWFVWQKQHPDNPVKSASHSTVSNTPPAKDNSYKVPEGYISYENKELGFKFAYPAAWGNAENDNDTTASGEKKTFGVSIKNGDELTAHILSYPKETCPQGDGVAISASQGWYEKEGKYYVTWCKYSPDANGSDYAVLGGGTVKKVNDQTLVEYTTYSMGGDEATDTDVMLGLFNLSKNPDYTGLSISRSRLPRIAQAELQKEFENVLNTFVEL